MKKIKYALYRIKLWIQQVKLIDGKEYTIEQWSA